MTSRSIVRLIVVAMLTHLGCGGPPTRPPGPASSPSAAPSRDSWQVQVGVERQRVPLAALGVEDRAAWLARRPQLVVSVDGSQRGRAQLAYPFVAAVDDPAAVDVLGFFGEDEARRESAWSVPYGDERRGYAGTFDVALVAGDGSSEELPGGFRTQVTYRLHPAEGPLAYTTSLGASGAFESGDGAIAVGPIAIRVHRSTAPRPRPLTVATGIWRASIGLAGGAVSLAALGITESVEELRHPRAELAFAGDRIAAPILPAQGDPAAVELLSSLSRHARDDDEFLSTSLDSAPSDSRSGHFELSVADDRGPAGVLVGDADHVIVTYAVLAEPCTRESGRCSASGVSYRVYAADGMTVLETGAAVSRDGLWILAVGPIEVAVVVHDVGWLQPD